MARNWTAVLDAMAGACVLCVGDLMLDRFVFGAVERISPEAPVPVLRANRQIEAPGGVGNVARNLSALNARVGLVASIGDDESGLRLAEIFREDPRLAAHLVTDATQPTTLKSRFISAGNHLLRVDFDPSGSLCAATHDAVRAKVEQQIALHKAVIISDYGKGLFTPELLGVIIAACKAQNVPVVVDPKGGSYEKYRGASVVTPNRKELAEATGAPVSDDREIEAAARDLIARHGIGAVLVTRSEEGMSLIVDGEEARHFRTEAAQVYDVAGAGDTVVAALAAAMACGLDLETAAVLANVAAGIVVRKVGTAVAHWHELRDALLRITEGRTSKFVDQASLLERLDIWHRDGLRIGFTNGCFDILHAGHVEMLRQARASVHRLIVGLNSDASVKRLKGMQRPVNPEAARAGVLAGLESVDAVVIFDEDTPEALIRAIRPDVLIKGSDYTIETVVGADFVQAHGGRVLLIGLQPGYSTTSIIAKLGAAG